MAEKIQLEIVTPTGPVVSEMVDIVTAPGGDGDFGVLAGHAPLLSTIRIGTLVYRNDDQSHTVMVNGGFCEVANNKITFLVESAEQGEEIDVDRAMRARARAEKRLAEAQRQQDNIDTARAETALHRAVARLRAGSK